MKIRDISEKTNESVNLERQIHKDKLIQLASLKMTLNGIKELASRRKTHHFDDVIADLEKEIDSYGELIESKIRKVKHGD